MTLFLWAFDRQSAMLEEGARATEAVALPIAGDQGASVAETMAVLNDLRAVVGGVPVILFALDRAGIFTLSEGGGLNALGRASGAVVGQSIFAVYRDQPLILDGVRRALTGASTTATVEINGTIYRAQYSPLRDAHGAIIGVLGLGMDITVQQRTEEALRQSDTRYRTLVAALADGVVMQTADGRIVASNLSAEQILGLSADQLAGRTSLDPRWRAIHEDGTPFPGEEHPAMVALASGAAQVRVPMGVYKPDGALAWLVVTAQPLVAPGETRPHAVVVSFTDVTDQRRAAAVLTRSEARFRALTEQASDIVVLTDEAGTVLYRSTSTTRLLGYPTDLPPTSNIFGMSHPDDRARVRDYLAACLLAADPLPPIELRLRHRDGSWRPFETVATNLLADPAVGGLMFTSRDIAARQAAEAALRESEARYRVILGALHEGVVLQDAEGRIIEANQAAERLLGLTADQLRGVTSLDPRWRAVHEDGTPCPGDEHPATIALRTGVRQCEIVLGIHTPDGALTWLLVTAEPLFHATSARPSGVVASFVDITARKRAEDALRESEARLQDFLDNANDLIHSHDEHGRFTYVNRAWHAALGYNEGELAALTVLDIIAPEEHDFCRAMQERLNAGEDLASVETVFVARNGRRIKVEGSVNCRIAPAGARLTRAIFRDVTARRALEERLAHQATHDTLTGLPNRALFLDRLTAALARADRSGATVAILFLDLDGFKAVNDELGHAAGDLLLAVTARRLLDCIRGGDTVARLGGDEFAVLLEPLVEAAGAATVARRIMAALALPVFVGTGEARVSASIGIAMSAPGDTADTLLSAADTAMYRVKRAGKPHLVAHEPLATR